MKHIERIDDYIKRYGSATHRELDIDCGIGNPNARITEAKRVYPIKRVAVRRKTPNKYGERPIYYRYYYDKNKVKFRNEEVVKWLDEVS